MDVQCQEFRMEVEKRVLKKDHFSVCNNMDEAVLRAWQGVVVLPRKTTLNRDGKGAQKIANANHHM